MSGGHTNTYRYPRLAARQKSTRTTIAGATFVLFVAIGVAMPSSFLVQKPGPVLDVTSEIDGVPVLEISGAETYDSNTELLLTTVSAFGNADGGIVGGEVARAIFDTHSDITPVRLLYPETVTSKQVTEYNMQQMDFSQDFAAAAAFELAGMDVSMTVEIAGVSEGSAAADIVEQGDVITGVKAPVTDGEFREVTTFRSLSAVLDQTEPGTDVVIRVERDGATEELTITTVPYPDDPTGYENPGSLLGVLINITDVELPADVSYVVDGIGGPSAGSMFTLAIYDAVTPESLGGDARIAGTGTVAWDGDIGPIGGIRHKMAGAARKDATDFLAPALNCLETEGYVPDGLNVWAVRTMPDAIEAVEAIGADDTSGLESCADVIANAPQPSGHINAG